MNYDDALQVTAAGMEYNSQNAEETVIMWVCSESEFLFYLLGFFGKLGFLFVC